VWHVIYKDDGKCLKCDKKIELKTGTKIISNSQNVAGVLNTFFL
jgi:hypothetical protein